MNASARLRSAGLWNGVALTTLARGATAAASRIAACISAVVSASASSPGPGARSARSKAIAVDRRSARPDARSMRRATCSSSWGRGRTEQRAGGDHAGRRRQEAEPGRLGDGPRCGPGTPRSARWPRPGSRRWRRPRSRPAGGAGCGRRRSGRGRRRDRYEGRAAGVRVVSHGVRLLGGAAAAPCSTVQTAPTFRKALTPSTRSIAPSFDAPPGPEVYGPPCRVGHPAPSPVSRFACARGVRRATLGVLRVRRSVRGRAARSELEDRARENLLLTWCRSPRRSRGRSGSAGSCAARRSGRPR
jgi:hypothetical protein